MSGVKEGDKEQRAIQLTLSNAVDQTRKIRVEVPAGTTVEEAARESGVFPAGAFDVFTAGGESVTHASVDEHRDEVLYVGPQKVAGGAMEPPHVKSIMFTSAFDPEVRHEVVPGTDQTVHQAAEMAGLGPRDGSEWQVYTAIGEDVGGQPAAELAGQVLYVGPKAIDAGGPDELTIALEDLNKSIKSVATKQVPWSASGITTSELNSIRVGYPSASPIRGHRLPNGNCGAITINMKGVKSHRDKKIIDYKIVVDFREFPSHIPNSFVMSPTTSRIKHVNIHHGESNAITPQIDTCFICLGGQYPTKYRGYKKDRGFRLRAYLSQLQFVLTNPNKNDRARHI